MNEIIKSLYDRKSVRVFKEDVVTNEIKQMLLESAIQAPTAGNQILYSIIDVTDNELKLSLSRTCDNQPFIAKAPVVFIFVADHTRWHRGFELAGANPRKVAVGDLMLAAVDTAIAAQNMVVAAESLGLGSCYIGDILENHEEHKALLNLPDCTVPLCMLVIGYPTEQQQKRVKPARFDLKYIVGENTYPHLNDVEVKACFNEQRERGLLNDKQDFNEYMKAFCKRKFNSEFSKEMTRSVEKYLKDFEDDANEKGE